MAVVQPLAFETDIHELEENLARIESASDGSPEALERLRTMRRELTSLKRDRYKKLTAWQTILVSRHPLRPQTMDYVDMLGEGFVELHGDRAFGDDRAIRTGLIRIGDFKVMLVGHQKGHTLKERQECLYGCAHPEGYRKAMNRMKFAAKFGIPVVCLIDTPGAYPGIGAEERGQSQLIATSILEMSRLPTPVVCVVIGEGGSGGALGIGIGDRVAMLEHAYYSVISPEGCAGILWKTANDDTKAKAAATLKLTSKDLLQLKVIDEVIAEPLGGAHRDPREMGNSLKKAILRYLTELRPLPVEKLLQSRYEKFRNIGVFLERPPPVQEGAEVSV